MDEQLGQKLTLVGWLALAGYELLGVAGVIGALTLDVPGEVAKRDRLYQLLDLAAPYAVGLVLLAALIGYFVVSSGSVPDAQAKLLVTATKVTAVAAALLAIALAISFATDDRLFDRWRQMIAALAGLPVCAAVLALPQSSNAPVASHLGEQGAPSTTAEGAAPPPPPGS